MNQKQSEDFDNRLRILADEAESAYQEKSWEKMVLLLDKKKRRGFLWWPWMTLGTVLILVGIGLYISSLKNIQDPGITSSSVDAGQSLAYAIHVTSTNLFSNLDLLDKPVTPDGTLANLIPGNTINVPLAAKENTVAKINTSNTPGLIKKSAAKALEYNPTSNKVLLKRNNPITHFKQEQADLKKVKSEVQHLLDRNQTQTAIYSNNKLNAISVENLNSRDPKSLNANASENPAVPMSQEQSAEKRSQLMISPIWNNIAPLIIPSTLSISVVPVVLTKPKKNVYHAVLISAHWAPEFTGVSKGDFGSLAQEYGFRIGYQITKRLSFVTGLQRTSKNYPAEKKDYFVEPTSYFYPLKFGTIKGQCKVLEFPMTFQYNLPLKKAGSLNFMGGLTSLRMDTEEFEYDYFHANGKLSHRIENYATKKWNWLSTVTFGLGYQKNVHKNLSFAVQPYYNIPLKGIGEGKVHLRSFGTQVGLQYAIPTSK